MKTIAIMVENSRAYGRSMIEGIAAYAQEARDWILRPLTVEDAFTGRLFDFDGVIARLADDHTAARLAAAQLPIVDVFCQKRRPGFIAVDSNHKLIGEMARAFFVSRGFQNLAYCGLPGSAFSDAREEAFATAGTHVYAGRAKRSVDESQFYAERVDRIPDEKPLRDWIVSLPKPVAVFCCNDLRAIQLQQVAREANLQVPEDVAILGVDDDTILCSYAQIPISSIRPNSFRVGYEAARLLHGAMAHTPSRRAPTVHTVKPGDIVERASTEFMPIDPPWLGSALIHIERNLRRPIGASEIFKLCARSGTYVEQIFRRKLGLSVQAYITMVKMREAKRLLADPSLRISEIADLCGFTTPQYFTRTFTATFNVNPKAYRNQGETSM